MVKNNKNNNKINLSVFPVLILFMKKRNVVPKIIERFINKIIIIPQPRRAGVTTRIGSNERTYKYILC